MGQATYEWLISWKSHLEMDDYWGTPMTLDTWKILIVETTKDSKDPMAQLVYVKHKQGLI